MPSEQKKRVCYFYDANVGNYHYGPGHPMRPHRIRMCHGLVMNYGLYKKMEIYRAKPANKWEMTQFHTDEYIDFLSRVTPDNMDQFQKEQAKFNVGDDSPVFEGLFEYCGLSAGGSMEGAARLNRGLCDIAINWAGGLHHAKKMEASGFCYVNDIVLGILELLRYYARVLYIDIDVHHGDGVEEAFYTTDRVMTVSFHKYGEFFPGTGELMDVGVQKGKYYSVNVPLRDGIDDESYRSTFEPVIEKVMEWYRPAAVVLQCGGDSLSGDKLGCFNLSMKGHANCVKFVKKFNLPTLVLGGGGYTMRNVARAWAYETGVVVGQDIGPEMPYNDYYEYYGPDYKLDVRASNMDNLNTPDYLEKIKTQVFENLSRTLFAPSVQMQEVPRDADMSEDEDEQDPDDRMTDNYWDRRIMPENEYYDSDEGEAQGSGNNVTSRHQRDYNDTNDVQMSQEEEDQIAEALKQDEANDTEKEVTIEHIQEQDTEMDAADEAETNGNIQSIKAVEEDTVMEDVVQQEEPISDERTTDKTENEELESQPQQTPERQVVESSPVQQQDAIEPQSMEQDKSPNASPSPKEAVSDMQPSEHTLEPPLAIEEKADEAPKHSPTPPETTTAAVTSTESPFTTQIAKEETTESADNQMSEEPATAAVEQDDIKLEETTHIESEAMETDTKESQVDEPHVNEPEVKEPEVQEPEVKEPEVKEPVAELPDIREPEVKEPEVNEPETKEEHMLELPEIHEPQVKEPQVNIPSVEEPEGQEPKENTAEIKEPEAMETDHNEPEAVESEITESHIQQVNEPEAKKTDSTEPEPMQVETKNVESTAPQNDSTSRETKHDVNEDLSDGLKPIQVQTAASTNLSAELVPQSPLSPAKAGVESEEEGEVKSVKSQSPPPSSPKDNVVESVITHPAVEEEEEEEEALEDGEIAE